MNRSRLILASLLLLAVSAGGSMSSTSASFTAATSTPANSVVTGALEDSQPNADPVTAGSVTLSWNAAPGGGAAPSYTVERTNVDGTDPRTVYTGTDTTFIDHGGIPATLKSRDILAISAGDSHSLAIDTDHHVYAWGLNASGQLGTGDNTQRSTPTLVTFPAGVTIATVIAGAYHSFAIDTDHHVYAWGLNVYGQLGTGDQTQRLTPTQIPFPAGATIATVIAGTYHSFAIDTDHHVYAWGNNVYGQLGTGDQTYRLTPTQITFPAGATIATVIAGADHSLAIDTDHHVYAWGNNDDGQLGTGDRTGRSTPTEIAFPAGATIATVVAGANHSFAIDTDHHVYAWGFNFLGQLGTGDRASRSTPTEITFPTEATIATVIAGANHSFAIDTDHHVYAWGDNRNRQLGTGDDNERREPTRVDMTYRACPARSTLLSDGTTCSLQSSQQYLYTVTTTVGGWTRTSGSLSVPTQTR